MSNKKYFTPQTLTLVFALISAAPLQAQDQDQAQADGAPDTTGALLRLGVGAAYGRLSEEHDGLSYARPNRSNQLQLTFGGAIGLEGALYLHASLLWQLAEDAPLVTNGRQQPNSGADLSLTSISPGLTWYFHGGASLAAHYHLPVLSTQQGFFENSTLAGHGLGLQLGYDWEVFDGLWLGLAATGLYARNEYTESVTQDIVALDSVYGGFLLAFTAR